MKILFFDTETNDLAEKKFEFDIFDKQFNYLNSNDEIDSRTRLFYLFVAILNPF
ncbi:MAG: hypothetical protein ACI8ZN_000333 [Bacteroidia bacterium]|jgi:hypothetical protein